MGIQGSGANPSQAKNQLANFRKGHAHNPSQGSGKFLLESEDSSRHHSRNSSTGSNIPTSTIVVETYAEPEQQAVNGGLASTGSYHALQNHENHENHENHDNHENHKNHGVASNLAEEAERLLQ